MRINCTPNFKFQNISFGNLSKQEKADFLNIKQAALNIIGEPDKSVFVYSSACLPQSPQNNTGIGTLLSQQGDEFLDVIKTYTTTNVMQDLPSGELLPNPPKSFYCAYEGSADAISQHFIEPEILMDKKFGNLITREDIDVVVKANNGANKDVLVNFENVVEPDSPFDKMLKKAYERLSTDKTEEIKKLRNEFKQYKIKNNDWLEYHSIHEVLSKKYSTPSFDEWADETDKKLFDVDYPEELRIARKKNILRENSTEIEFYKFKKFLADKCLGLAKGKVNEKGMKFGGDVAYQFSLSDMYGNPKAFVYDVYMAQPGMKIPALNFYQITDPNSPAAKILKQKTRLAAQRYDTLRMDVGWGYFTPILSNSAQTYYEQKPMGSAVVELIENTVKEVKGDKFNPLDILYEVEAGTEDFNSFNRDGSLIEPLRNRMKIYSSNYMNEGWGSNQAYLKKFNFSPSEFIYGASNRDTTPLLELATSDLHAQRKAEQVKVLSKIFNIQSSVLENSDEFIRAKNAEPLMAKNNFMFFAEFFGLSRKFNAHDGNGMENFRPKVLANPEQAYFDALKEGRAFNLMDGFEKIFTTKGLDKKYPELFSKIIEFKNKLYGVKPIINQQPVDIVAKAVAQSEQNKEIIEQTVKNNNHAKPILIVSAAALICYAAYELFMQKIQKNKNTTQK